MRHSLAAALALDERVPGVDASAGSLPRGLPLGPRCESNVDQEATMHGDLDTCVTAADLRCLLARSSPPEQTQAGTTPARPPRHHDHPQRQSYRLRERGLEVAPAAQTPSLRDSA